MTVEIRRIVTGVNAEGQALVIQDGLAPTTVSRPALAMEAALIWTDGPKLMPIPENLVSKALADLAAQG